METNMKNMKVCQGILSITLLIGLSGSVYADAVSDLYNAARAGDLGRLKELVGKGVDLDAQKDKWSGTALGAAAANGHLSSVRFLLDNEANPDLSTPIVSAAIQGHRDVVGALLAGGADVNAASGQSQSTALHAAASKDWALVRALLQESKININAQDRDGKTPLHEAARELKADIVLLLLEHGAKPNIKNKKGLIPLDSLKGMQEYHATLLRSAGIKKNPYRVIHEEALTKMLTPTPRVAQGRRRSRRARHA